MKNHMLWMIVACGLPLLLIFLAPSFGLTGNWDIFLFLLAMFAIHLLIPFHPDNANSANKDKHSKP